VAFRLGKPFGRGKEKGAAAAAEADKTRVKKRISGMIERVMGGRSLKERVVM
jgi:hypothetical protein